jgi:hypothetical protein
LAVKVHGKGALRVAVAAAFNGAFEDAGGWGVVSVMLIFLNIWTEARTAHRSVFI